MIEWRVAEDTEPDHPWPDRTPIDVYCPICEQSWLAHDGNAARLLDWMARAWP